MEAFHSDERDGPETCGLPPFARNSDVRKDGAPKFVVVSESTL